ncbi:hypothetical protein PI124_g18929 [Phytophthora idaei]|nr:hypothetical protein PI125_g24423 [Phytophthora idaei]KAG3125814.1 hypothetical protein PI126_g22602 [Phytophthora idaei]KAG3236059.1 hypothetical protein PI124_g18929 [Phytophthora idaei]
MLCSRFAVQHKLHEALFGDIWLCCDRQDANRVVAVKQIHLDRVRQAFTRTFQLDNPWSEGYTLNSLQLLEPHENVLQTLDQFLEGDTWFIVMEFCDGGDLCQTLESLPQHHLPEVEVLPLFLQIVRGVRWLHSNGIAHRDLSLENVLLSRSNGDGDGATATAKICDFGLSTEAERVCHERVGKVHYMAPEVVAGSAYDPRAADVWSLGIILFVLLTGSPLVPIASEIEAGFTALQEFGVERVVGAWHMDELLTPAAVDLLGGMLQVDPRDRLSVEEVMAHPALQLP